LTHFKLNEYYNSRESLINSCIRASLEQLEKSKTQSLNASIKEESYKIRVFQQELEIEKIIRARTFKVITVSCRLVWFHLIA
jgi:hypothetical protein